LIGNPNLFYSLYNSHNIIKVSAGKPLFSAHYHSSAARIADTHHE
jgi:hypothetical protein